MQDHFSYFLPLEDEQAERLAALLYRRHQEHEAVVAEWVHKSFDPWESVEPDIQRAYRAMALGALEDRSC